MSFFLSFFLSSSSTFIFNFSLLFLFFFYSVVFLFHLIFIFFYFCFHSFFILQFYWGFFSNFFLSFVCFLNFSFSFSLLVSFAFVFVSYFFFFLSLFLSPFMSIYFFSALIQQNKPQTIFLSHTTIFKNLLTQQQHCTFSSPSNIQEFSASHGRSFSVNFQKTLFHIYNSQEKFIWSNEPQWRENK